MKRQAMFIVLLCILFLTTIIMVGCTGEEASQEIEEQNELNEQNEQNEEYNEAEEKLLIYTSSYPLYDFATKIAGDHVEVINLIPAGSEPHDYEPKASDITALHNANLFVYNGGGLEFWIENLLEAVDNDDLVVVDSTEHIQLLSNEEIGHDNDHNDQNDDGHGHNNDNNDHGLNDDDDHGHGDFDPHVWVDPTLAKQQAESIKNAMVELDPDHVEDYEHNFAELAQEFDQLHDDFVHMTENIERQDFVVSHEAFGYLAHRYGLNQVGIAGLSPSQEPSGSQLEEIIHFVRDNDIDVILYENQVTPRTVEVVRDEVGVEALVLHNLEVVTEEDMSQGEDYFTLMRHNLEVLKSALGYQD